MLITISSVSLRKLVIAYLPNSVSKPLRSVAMIRILWKQVVNRYENIPHMSEMGPFQRIPRESRVLSPRGRWLSAQQIALAVRPRILEVIPMASFGEFGSCIRRSWSVGTNRYISDSLALASSHISLKIRRTIVRCYTTSVLKLYI